MHYVYMNEHIKEKEPNEPVICVLESGSKRYVYTDSVDIIDYEGNVVGRIVHNPKGLKAPGCEHHVRAYIEVYDNRLKVFNG